MSGVAKLGLGSGIGLVVGNMIGAGVFVSAGFMAQDLGPIPLLLAWVVGAVLALAGARAYAELARFVPRSGGEYRLLSELVHPSIGYVAGWASVLVGFSGPVAVAAAAAAGFLGTIFPGMPMLPTAAALIVGMTMTHAFRYRVSTRTQNALVVLKAVLVTAFAVLGLALGSRAWPTWTPPRATDGFAFSGWNAAIYSAEEMTDPRRDTPRAMLLGCALVGVLYLAVNWVFVANLAPARAAIVLSTEDQGVTLGHVVARGLFGEAGAEFMSVLMVVTLLSAMSAMIFVAARVYSSMAADGFLPRVFVQAPGTPPRAGVVLVGALSLALLFAEQLPVVLENVSALLTLFSALTAASLFALRRRGARPALGGLAAALVYLAASVWMLTFALRKSTLWIWLFIVVGVALAAYAVSLAYATKRRRH